MKSLRILMRKVGLQLTLIALGGVFVGFGIYRGEVGTVFFKAIYICLECIGIG